MRIAEKIASVFMSFIIVFALMPNVAFAEQLEKQQSKTLEVIDADIAQTTITNGIKQEEEVSVSAYQSPTMQTCSNETLQRTTDADSTDSWPASSLEYVYIGLPKLEQKSNQEISVGLKDSTTELEDATLLIASASGETSRIKALTISNSSAAFVFGESLVPGRYVIDSLEFAIVGDNTVHAIDLSDFEYSFDIIAKEDADEPTITAYYTDDDGNLEATPNLSTALNQSTTEMAFSEEGIQLLNSVQTSDSTLYAPVIALDAGHGGVDPGACANGLREADITWKIASACKSKLESYGFNVIMVRDQYGDYDSDDYLYRVQRALDQGAQAYISFHINSGSASATGAEVYAPTDDGSSYTSTSVELAYRVLNNLAELGLSNRFVEQMEAGDEFAVIRCAREAGIPGILIEHGFISNSNDCANFFTDEGCRKMGEADAQAIIDQFPKSTWVDYSPVYDYDYYIAHNPDVLQVFGGDERLTLGHFIEYGMKEGRQACANFNVDCYRANYDDLWIAYGNDLASYYWHYIAYGKNEGRIANDYLDGREQTSAAATSAQLSSDRSTAALKLEGGDSQKASTVYFAVWSEDNGQDDLHWWTSSRSARLSWSCSVNIASHGSTGRYISDCYAIIDDDLTFMGRSVFDVPEASGTMSIQAVDSSRGTFDAVLSAVSAPGGVEAVKFPVWSEKNGQDDIVWHEATLQPDGTWVAHISAFEHGQDEGAYNVHCYLYDGIGGMTFVGEASVDVSFAATDIAAEVSSDYSSAALRLSGASAQAASEVRFAVWSEDGGQDDIEWVWASQDVDGSWQCDIDIASHESNGRYLVHCYAIMNDTLSFLGQTTFIVPEASGTMSIQAVDSSRGTFDAVLSAVSAPGGVEAVKFPVWSEKNGQDDIVWHEATLQPDGTWVAHISAFEHGQDEGAYNVHCYLYDGIGGMTFVGEASVDVSFAATDIAAEVSSDYSSAALRLSGASAQAASEVRFAVWSEDGGQDDIEWVWAERYSNVAWGTSINVANHKSYGKYCVHCYVFTDEFLTFVGDTTFNVTAPSGTLSISNTDTEVGTFDVTLSNIAASTGVDTVYFPVWTEADQSDIVWYKASQQDNGSYEATINVLNHSHVIGGTTIFVVHAYVIDRWGVQSFIDDGTLQFELPVDYGGYHIMGNTGVSATAMANYYQLKGYAYPSYIYAAKGAATIEQFCELICEQAAKEGVRGEVVFVQAMLETGWLQFGGDVSAEQCNFAGLGATGGVPGNSFSDVAEGLLAQVQHLKGYASTQNLNETCVDPRFKYLTSKRGCSPTVEELGGPGKWAADTSYGSKLRSLLDELA